MLRRRAPRPTAEDVAAATERLRRIRLPAAPQPDYEVVAAAGPSGDDDEIGRGVDERLGEPESSPFFDPDPDDGGLRSLLPDTLAGGRVAPGRAGVAALALVALVGVLVTAVVVLRGRPAEVPLGSPRVEVSGRPQPEASTAVLVVDVAGKVRRPGVLSLPPGSRVVDALRRAGGPLPGVTTTGLNLARRLVDGEQLLVGVPGAAPAAGVVGGAGGSTAGGLLNLNTATVAELETLDGVGPVLAQRIVDWRDANGGFTSVDQLREVTGIGERKYAAMADQVTV